MKQIISYLKSLLCFLLVMIAVGSSAQTLNKLNLRGKVLNSLLLEDVSITSASLGLEYRISPRYSIGLDYIHLRNRREHDSADVNTNIFSRERSNATQLDVRYYFHPFVKIATYQTFYISAYYRFTNRWLRNDIDVPYSEGDRMSGNYFYNDIGLAFGYRMAFDKYNQVGADVNFGAAGRFGTETYTQYMDANNTSYFANEPLATIVPSIRVNFYFYLAKPLKSEWVAQKKQ